MRQPDITLAREVLELGARGRARRRPAMTIEQLGHRAARRHRRRRSAVRARPSASSLAARQRRALSCPRASRRSGPRSALRRAPRPPPGAGSRPSAPGSAARARSASANVLTHSCAVIGAHLLFGTSRSGESAPAGLRRRRGRACLCRWARFSPPGAPRSATRAPMVVLLPASAGTLLQSVRRGCGRSAVTEDHAAPRYPGPPRCSTSATSGTELPLDSAT